MDQKARKKRPEQKPVSQDVLGQEGGCLSGLLLSNSANGVNGVNGLWRVQSKARKQAVDKLTK